MRIKQKVHILGVDVLSWPDSKDVVGSSHWALAWLATPGSRGTRLSGAQGAKAASPGESWVGSPQAGVHGICDIFVFCRIGH